MDARTGSRWALALAAATALAFLAVPVFVRAFVGTIEALLAGCVDLAVAFSAGASGWSIARSVAASLILALATPRVSGALAALVVVAIGALWGLQRLLGAEGE